MLQFGMYIYIYIDYPQISYIKPTLVGNKIVDIQI